MNKKAQISNLQTLVITLVSIGIILGIGFLVFEEFQTQSVTGSETEVNESLTTVENVTGETVAFATEPAFSMSTDVDCINASDGVLVPDNNVTATAAGLIKSASATCDDGWCNYSWNCTYSYEYGQEAWRGINKTSTAMAKIPQWLGIVVILAIVGILLAILFTVFPRISGGGVGFGKGSSGGVAAEI